MVGGFLFAASLANLASAHNWSYSASKARQIARKSNTHSTYYELPGAENYQEDVGAAWDTIGPLQLEFLRGQGLLPQHRLLDLACGSLRGGVHFVDIFAAVLYTVL
eukprot:TRINITY_DN28286_c0_g1_i2.p3 TRINITY_DN28286_c0_g1~~TRINITY_DN28286_c0_g1_i2.p3  ORF type:complete len:106 (-),score=24.72 TRINITY_DN28286_c0_g1_i2:81-398(-)